MDFENTSNLLSQISTLANQTKALVEQIGQGQIFGVTLSNEQVSNLRAKAKVNYQSIHGLMANLAPEINS